jgi:hypothetical protein
MGEIIGLVLGIIFGLIAFFFAPGLLGVGAASPAEPVSSSGSSSSPSSSSLVHTSVTGLKACRKSNYFLGRGYSCPLIFQKKYVGKIILPPATIITSAPQKELPGAI